MSIISDRPAIKVLDETLINKIAAGEVIERPSSVVKELIENALDAKARNITVELQEAGSKLIAVHDDGIGMVGDDLELAFTRHATSKIKKAEDLFNILSFGFRGEALPSIGSVSQVRAVSRFQELDSGSELNIEGGKFLNNTPARRKFLKSQRSELSRIVDLVTSYAVGNFDVGFKMNHNKRELFNYHPVKTLSERLGAVYGYEEIEKFYPLPGTDEGRFDNPGTVLGYISHPSLAKSRLTGVRFYINSRPIHSRTLIAALKQGYQNKLEAKLYPLCAVFFNILPRDIDVNVHPAKTEVRFKDESALFIKLKRLVEHTLKTAGVLTDLSLDSHEDSFPGREQFDILHPHSSKVHSQEDFRESLYKGGFTSAIPSRPLTEPENETKPGDTQRGEYRRQSVETDPSHPKMWQFKDSFIVVPLMDSLLFIDQHNAHERVLFESILKQLNAGKTSTQQLLFPITVDLTPGEFLSWSEFKDSLEKIGFEIKEFGGSTVIISGIPAGMDDRAPELVLRKMLDEFSENDEMKENLHYNLAASFACHAAIKAGNKMKHEEMNLLCDRLFACEEYNVCPHGRPVIARLTIDEIEKKFQRNIPSKND